MGTLRRFEGGPYELYYKVREMPIWGSLDTMGAPFWGAWMSILLVEETLRHFRSLNFQGLGFRGFRV